MLISLNACLTRYLEVKIQTYKINTLEIKSIPANLLSFFADFHSIPILYGTSIVEDQLQSVADYLGLLEFSMYKATN